MYNLISQHSNSKNNFYPNHDSDNSVRDNESDSIHSIHNNHQGLNYCNPNWHCNRNENRNNYSIPITHHSILWGKIVILLHKVKTQCDHL